MSRLDFFKNLARVREPARFELGENEFTIDFNVEDPVSPGNQLGLNTQTVAQFIRQTGGLGFVVSLRAIVDLNFHGVSPHDFSRIECALLSSAAGS